MRSTLIGFNKHWDDLTSATIRLAPRQYVTSTSYGGLNCAIQLTLPVEPGNAERCPHAAAHLQPRRRAGSGQRLLL